MQKVKEFCKNGFLGLCKEVLSSMKVLFILGIILVGAVLLANNFSELFNMFIMQNLKNYMPVDILEDAALSTIERNEYLLFFVLFGSGLAIWARWANQTQLKHTKTQIKDTKEQMAISRSINRNDRFAKATEMLEKDKSEVSYRGGLYLLGKLMAEGDADERVLYNETITDWLKNESISPELKAMALKLLMEKR